MGKLTGLLQFTGKLDGLSFYEMQGKIIVRKTGGFEGNKIKKQPNYVRVRENSKEFTQSARAGKYFRHALATYLRPLRILYLHNRVVSLFQQLTKLDTVHARGERRLFEGLQTQAGQQLVKDFEFDPALSFYRIFPFSCQTNLTQGILIIPDFNPTQLPKPTGAAISVELVFLALGLDFETQSPALLNTSKPHYFSLEDLNNPTTSLELTITQPNAPVAFGILSVRFFEELNGVRYRLQGGGIKILGYEVL